MDDGGVFEDDEDGVRFKVVRGRFTVVLSPTLVRNYRAGRFDVMVLKVSGVPPRRCRKSIKAVLTSKLETPMQLQSDDCMTGTHHGFGAQERRDLSGKDVVYPTAGRQCCMDDTSTLASHALSCSPQFSGFSPYEHGCSSCYSEYPHEPGGCSSASRCHSPAPSNVSSAPSSHFAAAVGISIPMYARCDSGSSLRTKSYGSTASLASFLDDGLFSPEGTAAHHHWLGAQARADWDSVGVVGPPVAPVSPVSVRGLHCAVLAPSGCGGGNAAGIQADAGCLPIDYLHTDKARLANGCSTPSVSRMLGNSGSVKRRGRFTIYENDADVL